MSDAVRALLVVDCDGRVEEWQHAALRLACERGLEVVGMFRRGPAADRWGAADPGAGLLDSILGRLVPSRRLDPRDLVTAATEVAWFEVAEGRRAVAELAKTDAAADCVLDLCSQPTAVGEGLALVGGVLRYSIGIGSGRSRGAAELAAMRSGRRTHRLAVTWSPDGGDSGAVLAEGSSLVSAHSYAATVREARRTAVPLLAKALRRLPGPAGLRGIHAPFAAPAPYRPRTRDVVVQGARIAAAAGRRLGYGVLREQQWALARVRLPDSLHGEVRLDADSLRLVRPPAGFTFAADPAAGDAEGTYAELLDARSGLGRIARWRYGRWLLLDLGVDGHASYPQLVHEGARRYLLPELATVGPPRLFELSADGDSVVRTYELEGLRGERLVDATLHQHEGTWFLFGGRAGSEGGRLDLWSAPSARGPYLPHPDSPVCLDPGGARMAGSLAWHAGELLRFGQDGTEGYGGSVRVHRVERLSATEYAERTIGSIGCRGMDGPHTFSVQGDHAWIDVNRRRTTPMAGVRRIRARRTRWAPTELHPSSPDQIPDSLHL